MISYQLYSSRNLGTPDAVVRRVADLGYQAVEGYGAIFADADARAAVAEVLAETGALMPTAHVGLATLETDDDIADLLTSMGVAKVFVPFVPADERPTDAAGWQDFAARIEAAGADLRGRGVKVGWHNHDFEFMPLADGSLPMDHLMSADLDWQFDVAWAVRAGADPMVWIDKYGPRITAAHVKDIAPAGQKLDEDGWADPGTGTMDWPALSAALAAKGNVGHWVMEHDNPSDDERFARAGLDAARNLEGMQ